MIIRRSYGWKPSTLDHRDYVFGVTAPGVLPSIIDLSGTINWVYDQEQENSCVAQSTASLIRFRRKQQGLSEIEPARNFIYWCGRALENDTGRDEGMQIRSGMQSVSVNGYCHESLFGYSTFTVFNSPNTSVMETAHNNLVTNYSIVNQDHNSIRTALAAKTPFVFGMEVTSSFETQAVADCGIVPMPTASDKVLGGHAVFCVGYNDHSQQYKVLNSWGSGWGQKGYFYLPYAFLENINLASDLFTINAFRSTAGMHHYDAPDAQDLESDAAARGSSH